MSVGAITMELTEATRALIDARLDTIDRMLLGRVPREDRLAIVREVESRIDDLLREREGDTPIDRDDVIAALARLDPPEAYLPDELGSESFPRRRPAPRAYVDRPAPAMAPAPNPAPSSTAAKASGVIGIVAVVAVFLIPMAFGFAMWFKSEPILFLGGGSLTFLAFVCGIVAISLSVAARPRDTWAVVGLVLGIISPLLAILGVIVGYFIA